MNQTPLYITATLKGTLSEDELGPITTLRLPSKANKKKIRPRGFYNLVRKFLGTNIKCSQAMISMVRTGRRKNDAVLMAIIQADHALHHHKDSEELLYSLLK